ncbi:hypothetical protein JGS22_007940 [Streptomyces sp. P38-E01]|uniref:Uncharacterized protein n=1 Tax=Streptomyces tardus TaxID=2780544 RepID=A0A949JFH9_9ACTN|nr:hypothetical protein [Streptomyces tardus]MBU7597554.1 hypothetical protein [Streptomyces tardus]
MKSTNLTPRQIPDADAPLQTIDEISERIRMDCARDVLANARALVAESENPRELKWTVHRLIESLTDAIRVADARGERLPGSRR